MTLTQTTQLNVFRRLSDGQAVAVGKLKHERQGIFFAYDVDYLAQYGNLSPFKLGEHTDWQISLSRIHMGLHGVLGDCLPDGWGLLLQDRLFRQQGLLPSQVSPLDRLAFVGETAIGALFFEPMQNIGQQNLDFAQLGLQAQAVFDGQTDKVLYELIRVGSSGGARPKAQIFRQAGQPTHCHTQAQKGDEAWLVKFTSRHLPLGHEEGICEAVYLSMAQQLNLNTVEFELLPAPLESGARYWLALKRFDWHLNKDNTIGRTHIHSACGLLDADFRIPSLDYEDLIKATRLLCHDVLATQLQFRRAIFNLLALNQDDHSKNWAFQQYDDGKWQPSPFYDVTFSPQAFGEHATAFSGYGKQPPLTVIQKLADLAGFDDWHSARQEIAKIADVFAGWGEMAKALEVEAKTIHLIRKQLEDNLRNLNYLYQTRG